MKKIEIDTGNPNHFIKYKLYSNKKIKIQQEINIYLMKLKA